MKRNMKAILIILVFVFTFMPAASVKATETDIYVVASNVTSRTAHVDWSGLLTYCSQMGYSFSYFEVTLDSTTIYENTKDTSMDLKNLNVGRMYIVWVTTHCTDSAGNDATFESICSFTTLGSGLENVTDADTSTDNPADPFPAPSQDGTVALVTPTISKLQVANDVMFILVSNAPGADGYEIEIYDKNGKLVKTDYSTTYDYTMYGIPSKSVIYIRIRTYGYDSNYDKVYSNWTAKKCAVVQPKIKANSIKTKANSIKISWGKIKGAKSYTIYGRKRYAKKWVKVATTKKTSYTVTKIKGNRINLRKSHYELSVTATAKVGKKTLKSGNYDYIYTY